jgi:hypothetical protein
LLADAEASEEAAKMWKRESELREGLTDSCERENMAEKAVWFQETFTKMLNKHAKQLQVTAYSKRWWSPKILLLLLLLIWFYVRIEPCGYGRPCL